MCLCALLKALKLELEITPRNALGAEGDMESVSHLLCTL
jgi:hypothetical protein